MLAPCAASSASATASRRATASARLSRIRRSCSSASPSRTAVRGRQRRRLARHVGDARARLERALDGDVRVLIARARRQRRPARRSGRPAERRTSSRIIETRRRAASPSSCAPWRRCRFTAGTTRRRFTTPIDDARSALPDPAGAVRADERHRQPAPDAAGPRASERRRRPRDRRHHLAVPRTRAFEPASRRLAAPRAVRAAVSTSVRASIAVDASLALCVVLLASSVSFRAAAPVRYRALVSRAAASLDAGRSDVSGARRRRARAADEPLVARPLLAARLREERLRRARLRRRRPRAADDAAGSVRVERRAATAAASR